jgi:DNA polymerase-1
LQGTAAEVLKRAMVEMSNAGLEDYMLLPVHDEIVFSVPEAEATDVMATIQETMSVHGEFDVAIPAEPEGPLARWGQKYE